MSDTQLRTEPFAVTSTLDFAAVADDFTDLPVALWHDDEDDLPWSLTSTLSLSQLTDDHRERFEQLMRALSQHVLAHTLTMQLSDSGSTLVFTKDPSQDIGWRLEPHA